MSDIVGKYLGPLFIQEAPTGVIDGVNTAFVLSQSPASNGAVKLFLNGIRLTQGVHYNLSGVNITTTDAPGLGQDLQAEYVKA